MQVFTILTPAGTAMSVTDSRTATEPLPVGILDINDELDRITVALECGVANMLRIRRVLAAPMN